MVLKQGMTEVKKVLYLNGIEGRQHRSDNYKGDEHFGGAIWKGEEVERCGVQRKNGGLA